MTSVLVTGAAGDLGGAIATALATAGARFVLTDHANTEERLSTPREASHLTGLNVEISGGSV